MRRRRKRRRRRWRRRPCRWGGGVGSVERNPPPFSLTNRSGAPSKQRRRARYASVPVTAKQRHRTHDKPATVSDRSPASARRQRCEGSNIKSNDTRGVYMTKSGGIKQIFSDNMRRSSSETITFRITFLYFGSIRVTKPSPSGVALLPARANRTVSVHEKTSLTEMAARTRCDRPVRRELQGGSQGTAAAAGGGGVWQRCPHTSQSGQQRHR